MTVFWTPIAPLWNWNSEIIKRILYWWINSNRTFMELKFANRGNHKTGFGLLQSHLYGIEIFLRISPKGTYLSLQSHLYGIEIGLRKLAGWISELLQSHLYGIEIKIWVIRWRSTATPIAPLWNWNYFAKVTVEKADTLQSHLYGIEISICF